MDGIKYKKQRMTDGFSAEIMHCFNPFEIAIAERYRIPATTPNVILTVKSHGQKSAK
jgi:hypothetical protein